jgi:signal transduction histidine kinase
MTLVAAAAITLVGMSVIVGWHLYARALVQIIPGTIPMQYNTAMCFLVLGASAFALVAQRGHRLLPVLGGSFVTLMGVLVVFQYVTGIPLGIDTALFYPWERTLSADPGRMALTTAVCFVSTGGALLLLTWRPRALAVFAIAHTLPLSLGLTSTLGYLVGITYVLPFRLGSQMAIHTALAFLAYGIAMLAHAWRLAPRTEEGLPQWSPDIAIAMVPVLFVGTSITAQNNSASTWSVPLFIGLLSAGLFGLAAHKLTQSRIAHKGLILISVPLVFVLAFVVLVTQVKRHGEEAQIQYLRSKDVIVQAEAISKSLLDAEASIRSYVLTGDPAFAAAYDRAVLEIPEKVERLQSLVQDNPEQTARAARLGTIAAEKMAFLGSVEQLVRTGATPHAIERIKNGTDLHLTGEFQREAAAFLETEQHLDVMRQQAVEDSWQRFNWLLAAGASVDILLTLMLAFLFSRGIGKRVSTLTENARALAEGKELTRPMQGTDEIARLDQAFHRMAQSLENRTAQLQAANKELEAFSYSVSHDLRAPLRAIDGFSRILLEDYACKLDAEGARVLNVIRANTQNMGRLIDDLLTFSRLGRKQIEPAIINMGELARDAFTQLEPSLSGRAPKLNIKNLPPAHGDRALLQQVFVNLLSNAAKYSRPKEPAVVEVGGHSENGENIYYVKDNGVGFDMKYADKLFGVFQRLHSAEEFEGTGVGLAIVQRVVGRHGGRVWAEGKVDEGATFYFTLPRNGDEHDG